MWTKLKHLLWQGRAVWIAAPSAAALVLALRSLGLLQMLELAALDRFFVKRPIEAVDDRIVIVDITEVDVRKTRQWPMSDTVLTKLLDNIKVQEPRVIGLDLYRDLPVEPGYKNLAKLFESTPNLIGIRKVAGDAQLEAVPPPPALRYPAQVGTNDLPLDPDGKIRRFFLSLPIAKDRALYRNETALDGFGVKLALRYLQAEGIKPEVLDADKKHYKLGKAVLVPFSQNDGGYVGANNSGYQILLNYRGRRGSFRKVSMTEVLKNRIPPDLMRDRIVIIGASAVSLNDLFYTPYSSSLLTSPERIAGVEIHANIASQIVSSAMSGRTSIKTWSDPLEWLWIFIWSVVGAALIWTQHWVRDRRRRSPWYAVSIVLLAGVSLFGISYIVFLQGWWIPVVPPLLAMTVSALAITAYIAKTAGDIRKTFGRYLTDEVVANLLETPEGLKLGGERTKVTIMMTDLRGFSAVSERLPPESVIHFLNIYLGAMADIITQYQGTIDEFIGDAILVIFGAPAQRKDDAERAVACAVAMQREMDEVNKKIKHLGMPKLEMGIAINTGEVVVGNIGSEKRAKYGVVGSHVNLTGRIESYTVGGQILISEYTYEEAVGDNFKIRGQIKVEPKGIKQPISLYDIAGVGGKYNIFLPEEEDNMLTLKEAIPLKYNVLDGKHVVGELLEGRLVKLSETGAQICAGEILPALSNIKILLTPKDGAVFSPDLYGKVIVKDAENDHCFCIRFTAIPPEVEALISKQLAENKAEKVN